MMRASEVAMSSESRVRVSGWKRDPQYIHPGKGPANTISRTIKTTAVPLRVEPGGTRSHGPLGDAAPAAPRPEWRRGASKTAFPRGPWERGRKHARCVGHPSISRRFRLVSPGDARGQIR